MSIHKNIIFLINYDIVTLYVEIKLLQVSLKEGEFNSFVLDCTAWKVCVDCPGVREEDASRVYPTLQSPDLVPPSATVYKTESEEDTRSVGTPPSRVMRVFV